MRLRRDQGQASDIARREELVFLETAVFGARGRRCRPEPRDESEMGMKARQLLNN